MMFKLTCYKDNQIIIDFDLNKSKMLLGSAENCDLTIKSEHISSYHCMLVISDDFIKVIDLDSINGTFVNDQKMNTSILALNDTLMIGVNKFFLESSSDIDSNVIKMDKTTQKVDPFVNENTLNFQSQLQPIENFTIVDGEYCNLNITEPDNFTNVMPTINVRSKTKHHIDLDNYKNKFDIFKQKNDKLNTLEITHVLHGNLIEVISLPMLDGIYLASPNKLGKFFINIYSINEEVEIFTINKNKISLCKEVTSLQLKETDDGYTIIHKNEVLYLKIKSTGEITKKAPFLGRDHSFQKKSTAQFGIVFSLALLCLLFKPEIKKNIDIIPIVYKKIIKNHKRTIASSGSKSSSLNPFKKIRNKIKKLVSHFKSPKHKSKPIFKLQLKTKMVALNATTTKLNSKTSLNVNRSIASLDLKNHNRSNNLSKIVSKSVGEGSGNWGNKKYGLKGYGNKKGYESAYGMPRTVILGSIDPELLRKIIREHLPQFKRCYQKELEINEKLKGVIGLNFRILKDGNVERIKIHSKYTHFSQTGSDCMSSVLSMIRFPHPKGGGVVDIKQPLNFYAEKNKI